MFARSSNWLKLAPLPPLHDNDDDDDGNNGDDVGDFCNDKDCLQLLYKVGSSWLHSLITMMTKCIVVMVMVVIMMVMLVMMMVMVMVMTVMMVTIMMIVLTVIVMVDKSEIYNDEDCRLLL